MPWNKKTKTADDWKPVRVRKAWLDVVREAGELQPKASPTLDLTTCSEPKLLEYACKLACSTILGWLDPVRQKEVKELEDAHKLKTANVVAKVFGASAMQESEGWISIVENEKVICYLSSDMNIVAAPFYRKNDKRDERKGPQGRTP